MKLFESLDRYFQTEEITEAVTEEVTLEVKFEAYERYAADAPAIFTQTYTGKNFLDALINALDSIGIFQYIGCYYDMNADQIISNLEMSNGDGCEYIFYIKNLNSGDIIFEGDFNAVEFEEDLDEALSAEDARNASEAADKAKEYFDEASKACDAILKEEIDVDVEDESYVEEEKVLDFCELSYEKDGKKVREKFNTIIEAKERRAELGLNEKNSTITIVYESGELELVESVLKEAECTLPDCEEEKEDCEGEACEEEQLEEAKESLSQRLRKRLAMKTEINESIKPEIKRLGAKKKEIAKSFKKNNEKKIIT